MLQILLLAPWFSLVVLAGPDYSAPGPYPVGESRITVTRTNQTTFEALVYFPADAAHPALVTSEARPFPVIGFAHGFLSPPELYRTTSRHLASWGFVVSAPRSGLEPFPDHSQFADDLNASTERLIQLGRDPSSSFYERLNEGRIGLTGHSMGGGATLLAAARATSVVAVAAIAAAETRPSAIEQTANIATPILYITGSEDSFVPNPFHTGPMFRNTRIAAWFDIRGGYHCGFIRPKLPEAVCDEGSISRFQQLAITHRLLTAYFLQRMNGDAAAWNEIWGPTPDFNPQLAVRRSPIADVHLSTRRLTVKTGAPNVITATVNNLTPSTRNLTVAVDHSPLAVTITPDRHTVAPGTSAEFTLVFTTPPANEPRRGAALIRTVDPYRPEDGGAYQWLLLHAEKRR